MSSERKNGNPAVFLSYAAQDASEARNLERALALAGIDVWSDTKLRVGERWREVIAAALESADVILVLITPASLASEWVALEWQTAFMQSKRVIPVLARGASYGDLPPALADIQAVDLHSDYESEIRNLVAAIELWSASTEPPPVQELDVQTIIEDTLSRTLERLGIDTRQPPRVARLEANEIFVLISFDPAMDPTFAAIKAAAQRVGMTAERAKDLKYDFRVTETILEKIDSARMVVADLTLERPNVYFELGYARGKGKTIVTLLKEGSKAHVDVRGWNYLEYIDSRPWRRTLLNGLKLSCSKNRLGHDGASIRLRGLASCRIRKQKTKHFSQRSRFSPVAPCKQAEHYPRFVSV